MVDIDVHERCERIALAENEFFFLEIFGPEIVAFSFGKNSEFEVDVSYQF